MSIKILEVAVLILVVAHAAQHLPHDLAANWERIRQMTPNEKHWITNTMIWLTMAVAASISFSPFVYYSIECVTRLVGERLTTA